MYVRQCINLLDPRLRGDDENTYAETSPMGVVYSGYPLYPPVPSLTAPSANGLKRLLTSSQFRQTPAAFTGDE